VVTLSTAVWDRDTKPLDKQRKHQIFSVTGFDFSVGDGLVLSRMSGGTCRDDPDIFCCLIDTFGSLVFHPAFAASNIVDGKVNGRSVNDMFLGKKF
jgi:hypothetical protein